MLWKKHKEFLFSEMKRVIEMYEMKNLNSTEEENQKCKHDFKNVEGIYTCVLCGLADGEVMDNDGIELENKIGYRPYQRQKHLRDLLNRISGHKYKEKKDNVNLDEMPCDMQKIRKQIRKCGLHQKNDYYYWRIKNNIETKISGTDLYNWCGEFRKLKNVSPHSFLFEKFSNNEKYSVFVELFERKTINKNALKE